MGLFGVSNHCWSQRPGRTESHAVRQVWHGQVDLLGRGQRGVCIWNHVEHGTARSSALWKQALPQAQSEFLPSFFALAQRALAASEILFLAAADIPRVPGAFRGLPLFAVLLPERASMATTIRSRWSISSERIASVSIIKKLYKLRNPV